MGIAQVRDVSYLALFNKLMSLCDLEPRSKSSVKIDRICEVLDDVARPGKGRWSFRICWTHWRNLGIA